jgi:two-component system response regulator WspF
MRVAIVDDLATAREVLRRLVLSVPGYSVSWTAENGEEAVHKAAQDRPDVILMDLVMPVLDGAEATRRIMAQGPCPILLVTSSVSGNFNLVYRAMGHGGLDPVNTPTLGPDNTIRDGGGILARLARLARARHSPMATPPPIASTSAALPRDPALPLVVALGASTGSSRISAAVCMNT